MSKLSIVIRTRNVAFLPKVFLSSCERLPFLMRAIFAVEILLTISESEQSFSDLIAATTTDRLDNLGRVAFQANERCLISE